MLGSSAIAVGWCLLWILGSVVCSLVVIFCAVLVLLIPCAIFFGTAVADEWATWIFGKSGMNWLYGLGGCGSLVILWLRLQPSVTDLYSRLRLADPNGWRTSVTFWPLTAACTGTAVAINVWLNILAGSKNWFHWIDVLPIAAIGLLLLSLVSHILSRYHALCPAANRCCCHELTYCRRLCRRCTAAIQRLTDLARVGKAGAICGDCLLRITLCHDDAVNLAYYRCRGCRRIFGSEGFLDRNHVLVAVLDRRAAIPQQVTNRHILVHVIQTQKLFDLDRVVVYDADEEQVERYVMLLQNDSDEQRRDRYARATCLVDATRPLSAHAMSILRSTFREVKIQAPPTQSEWSICQARAGEARSCVPPMQEPLYGADS